RSVGAESGWLRRELLRSVAPVPDEHFRGSVRQHSDAFQQDASATSRNGATFLSTVSGPRAATDSVREPPTDSALPPAPRGAYRVRGHDGEGEQHAADACRKRGG